MTATTPKAPSASSWSLITLRLDGEAGHAAAILRPDGAAVIPDVLGPYAGLAQALDDWEALAPRLRDLDVAGLEPARGRPALSIRHPRKVLCMGANYRSHLAEMGVHETPPDTEPYFFTVPPTTALSGDGDTVLIPADPAFGVDWEAELAVVIGRGGRDIDREDALGHVAGYACFNDITARGLLRRQRFVAPPFQFDWTASKGQDGFSALGAVTPAWQVGDPAGLGVRCLVNGVLKQDGVTSDLIFGIPDVIAAASRNWTLEPGDVIATGTPAGVGHPRGEHLRPGDRVRVEIDGLAPLETTIAERPGRD